MHVQLLVTHKDGCLPNLKRDLDAVGIDYCVDYMEVKSYSSLTKYSNKRKLDLH